MIVEMIVALILRILSQLRQFGEMIVEMVLGTPL